MIDPAQQAREAAQATMRAAETQRKITERSARLTAIQAKLVQVVQERNTQIIAESQFLQGVLSSWGIASKIREYNSFVVEAELDTFFIIA